MKAVPKKPKLESSVCNVDLYHTEVVLLVGDKELIMPWARKAMLPERLKYLEDHLEEYPIRESDMGRMLPLEGGGSIIWMPDAERKGTLATLVHECSHAAYYMLAKKNVRLCSETDEVFAYLVEFIFNCLFEGLKKR